MPIYRYKALSSRGKIISGEVAAASGDELQAKLSEQGLLLQSLSKNSTTRFKIFKKNSVASEDLLLFTQEFATLLKAGLTIADALQLVADRPKQKKLEVILAEVHQRVVHGEALSEACAYYPEVFDALFLSGLRTGEQTGDLVYSLRRYQSHLRRRIDLTRRVSQALIYPAILFTLLLVVLVVLFTFVIPRFVEMYVDIGADIPAPTQLLIDFSTAFPIVMLLLLVATIIIWWGNRYLNRRPGAVGLNLKARIPGIKNMLSHLSMARLSRSMATLLGSGGTVHEALITSAAAVSNNSYSVKILQAAEAIRGGSSLAQSLAELQLLTPAGIKLIEVGEASGALPDITEEMAAYYEEQLDNWLNRVMQLMEPLLMLAMGLIVGTVVIVMYLPIFSMTTVIQ